MLSPSGRSTYKMEPIPSHRAKAIFQEYLDRRTTEKRNRLQMAKRIMTWYSDLESEVSEHFDKALQSTVNKRPRLDTEEMQRCSIKPIHLDTSFSDCDVRSCPSSSFLSPTMTPLPSLFPSPLTTHQPTMTYPEYYHYTDEMDPIISNQSSPPSWSEETSDHHYNTLNMSSDGVSKDHTQLVPTNHQQQHQLFGYLDDQRPSHIDITQCDLDLAGIIPLNNVPFSDHPGTSYSNNNNCDVIQLPPSSHHTLTLYQQSSDVTHGLQQDVVPSNIHSSINGTSYNHQSSPCSSIITTTWPILEDHSYNNNNSRTSSIQLTADNHFHNLSSDFETPPTTFTSSSSSYGNNGSDNDSWLGVSDANDDDIIDNIRLDWTEKEVNELQQAIIV